MEEEVDGVFGPCTCVASGTFSSVRFSVDGHVLLRFRRPEIAASTSSEFLFASALVDSVFLISKSLLSSFNGVSSFLSVFLLLL